MNNKYTKPTEYVLALCENIDDKLENVHKKLSGHILVIVQDKETLFVIPTKDFEIFTPELFALPRGSRSWEYFIESIGEKSLNNAENTVDNKSVLKNEYFSEIALQINRHFDNYRIEKEIFSKFVFMCENGYEFIAEELEEKLKVTCIQTVLFDSNTVSKDAEKFKAKLLNRK